MVTTLAVTGQPEDVSRGRMSAEEYNMLDRWDLQQVMIEDQMFRIPLVNQEAAKGGRRERGRRERGLLTVAEDLRGRATAEGGPRERVLRTVAGDPREKVLLTAAAAGGLLLAAGNLAERVMVSSRNAERGAQDTRSIR